MIAAEVALGGKNRHGLEKCYVTTPPQPTSRAYIMHHASLVHHTTFYQYSIMADYDHAARLEPFLLLARSTKGAAAAKVISDATAAVRHHSFPFSLRITLE